MTIQSSVNFNWCSLAGGQERLLHHGVNLPGQVKPRGLQGFIRLCPPAEKNRGDPRPAFPGGV
jgi:hypothetical protein